MRLSAMVLPCAELSLGPPGDLGQCHALDAEVAHATSGGGQNPVADFH